jgi:hypothetical protein
MSATRSRVLLGMIVSLVGNPAPAVADDAEVSQASFDTPWCRSSAHDTVDLLLSSDTYVFDSNELKSKLAGLDGYRMRVTFDDQGRLVRHQIDPIWSFGKGSRGGFFTHPMFGGNVGDMHVHVRDDGSIRRFLREEADTFLWQDFVERTRTWGEWSAMAALPHVRWGNLVTEGNRWQCVELGEPISQIAVFDTDSMKRVEDPWLVDTLIANLKQVDFKRSELRVSNRKNFVLRKLSRDDHNEFTLFGRGMDGPIKFVAPPGARIRAVSESDDMRAAVIFGLYPEKVYVHEVDRGQANRTFDLENAAQVRSKTLCDAAYDVWYHAADRSIVGVDADFEVATPSPTIKFTAKARVARWNLKTGKVLETTIPYGEHFHVADRHVFPKQP